MRRAGVRLVSLLLLLVLVAAACGSDRGEDTSGSGDDGGGTPSTTKPQGETFGTLASPCGEGDATGATDQGVTNDQITIAYGDDAGFQTSPGLSHEASDAVKAFTKWCNDQGGINGRKIVGKYYDAKLLEVVNAVTQACQSSFMLVGEAWALDSNQEETRLGCDLPAVPTYSVSAVFANAPLMFQGVPNPIDKTPAAWADQLAKLYPEEVKHAAVMYGNFSATIDTKDKILQAFPKFGWKFLPCPQEYNILGEADWKPFAQKLKNCGAQVVYYAGQAFPNLQNMLDDAKQVGFEPVWVTDANNYIDSFAKWNTNGYGNKVHSRTAFTPFEQAADNKATQDYVDIVTANKGDTSLLGLQATSSFLLWATAAKQCGSNLTRDCVVEELSKVHSWDAGGLHVETDPGANLPPECGMLLKLEGTKWVQAAPEAKGEFDCDPSYVVDITGRVVDQADLGPDRVSTKYKK